jgi:hypothetical protein
MTSGFNRRIFLKGSSLAVAAAGAAAAMPGLPGLLGDAEADAPGVEASAGAGASAASDLGAAGETIVAHLRDASTGEIALYAGERQIVVRSPQLAAQLLRAVR